MANDTANDTETEPAKIEFLQFHQPVLKDGDYTITVEQSIQTTADRKIPQTTFSARKKFTVAGERFAFSPALVHSVFPPAGSLGEHSNVLPHIVLNRSTLPWERMANENREDIPWLALLLFDSDEAVKTNIVTLGDLVNSSGDVAKFPGIELETGQQADDKVTVIDVARTALEKIIPSTEELAWLSHARQGTDAAGVVTGDELAVIIGNRLPRNAGISAVHLVSVENRYGADGFDFQQAEPDDLIRLVSLKSWNFACVDKKQDFKGLLENLDPYAAADFNRRKTVLRLPPQADVLPEAEKYLATGSVPLPHFLRQGDKTVSWYHGPLITGENSSRLPSPVRAADELLRYNSSNGMFDVSYAAAWELGRLLALQSKKTSVGLYQWKRANVQAQKQAEQQLLYAHLPGQEQAAAIKMPDDIRSWFDGLSLLQGVPFNYLVPDERMLPKESVRFFRLDSLWTDCLLDGAFSIGRVTASNQKQEQEFDESPATSRNETVCGCLLRSAVVSDYPGLLVDAYDDFYDFDPAKGGQRLQLLRMDRLSANVLLCLFTGAEIKRLEVHQKPETLHFGFDVYENPPFNFYKTFRDVQGEQLNDADGNPIEIEIGAGSDLWKHEPQRCVNVKNLAAAVRLTLKPFSRAEEAFTSAQFALQMIEGVEKVIFETQK